MGGDGGDVADRTIAGFAFIGGLAGFAVISGSVVAGLLIRKTRTSRHAVSPIPSATGEPRRLVVVRRLDGKAVMTSGR